jgi:hypothetical protein
MKKLFKSFGLAVVITVIALNALLVTGCPDVGVEPPKEKDSSKPDTTNPTFTPDPDKPTLDGKGKTITLGANRWGTQNKGENWSSGDQIKLADFAGIKLAKGNTYSFSIKGKSDVALERVQLQIFSGSKFETWLGESTSSLINLGTDFDEVFSIKIDNASTPNVPVIIQLNNIMWQTDSAGNQKYPAPYTPIPNDIEQGTVMATITDLSISLYDVLFANPPELSPVEERWVTYVNEGSTATLDYSLNSDGVMIAIVGGTAMPNVWGDWNAWRAQISYYYTAEANAQYTFKFEAWTASGTRNLHLQYYENVYTDTYLASDVPITSTRTTYEVISDIIPTGGLEAARFILADQLGTVYIKIIEIKKYVFAGGSITVSNISGGDHGLEIGSMLEGSTNVRNGLALVFGSAPDKYEVDGGDWAWHWFGKEIKITGDPVTIRVWQVNYNTNTYTPFTGNITIPTGELELQQSHFKRPNNAWSGDDYYYNIVPITFTNGNASINFGTQMEYDGTWIPGENGEDGHYVSPYQATVTGIGGKTGHVQLGVYSAMNTENGEVFWGDENISGNSSVTINLRKNNEAYPPFTGSGSYYISLNFFDLIPREEGGYYLTNLEEYYYTNGQTFASLGITQESDIYNKLPKYTIMSMPFTIDLSKFQKRPEPQEYYDSSRITTVTITNIGNTNYHGGDILIRGSDSYNYSIYNKFSSNSLTAYFLDVESGSYLQRLNLYGNGESEEYVYTGGQTFDQLGITSENDLYADKLPKYPISSGTNTINFNLFRKLPKPYEWYANYKTTTITGIPDGLWGSFYPMMSDYNYGGIYSTYSWNGTSQDMTTYWVNYESNTDSFYLVFNSNYYDGSSMVYDYYVYTNGQTLSQLNIASSADLYSKLPKFTISAIPGTINFSKFVKLPSGWLP